MYKAQFILLALAVAGAHAGYGDYSGGLGGGYGSLGTSEGGSGGLGGGYGGHGGYSGKSYAVFQGPVEGHAQEIRGTVADKHGKHVEFVDYVAYPKYKYEYGVEDHHTGDQHGQVEHRDGDRVEGQYTLKEPGGVLRTVKYVSDKKGGFFADVENHGHNEHVYILKDKHGHGHQQVKATSYVNFHGPVVGDAQEITVSQGHGHYGY
ncbi:hypothetical protein R5R35_008294 [Gryllus longicercus]|uniref:Cuticular protein n=1 Tax=Gryllus longicercus TaxID=2509291 RepID=A0AAN9ZCB4_9ORTH